MTEFRETLPVQEAVSRWAAACSVAGAMLPAFVRDALLRLDWEAGSENVDMYDVLEAVADACRDCAEHHRAHYYGPLPRGLAVHCRPSGSVDIVWESDSHTTRLQFAGSFSYGDCGLSSSATLVCETENVDSDRLAACRGEQTESEAI